MKKLLIFLFLFASMAHGQTLQQPRHLINGSYVGTDPEPGGSSPFILTNAHYRTQVINPSGAITVELPTTGVLKGDTWKIVNRSTGEITVRSSDDTTISIVNMGYLIVAALQNAPTGGSHWQIVDISEKYNQTSTFTGPCTLTDVLGKINRKGNLVCLYVPQAICTSSVGTYFTMSTLIPSRFRVPTEFKGHVRGNSAGFTNDMSFTLSTAGGLLVYANASEGNFASSGNAGWYGISTCWSI